ncbi:ClpP/crotonase-like domain-containing protein [Dactylonectria macrodidyma]|uniref:ClpP/crotonase-like domain-containing protein n=1 Tax=Dactylonectria macrodidyma TaxID=307937 RepID=A0A9P9DL57_9HYPO|nr:ClpP/crotonase-like domain-containing protein [Dactylonectria macrodidyma]
MQLPSYANILVQLIKSNHIAWVKLNRPQSGNSLHPQLLSELVSALKWVNNHPVVRVIILSGEGRFFCTGMDLVHGDGMSFARGSDFHELNKTLILSEKVMIAAVNGPAVGYGVSTLALYDLVYSVPDAYLFTPFVKWGMAAEGASSFSFPLLMGHQRAAALFLAGEQITAQEAQNLGLINKIFPKDTFFQKVLEIAEGMSQSPPGSLKATKRLMKEPVMQYLLDANNRECDIIHAERYGFGEYKEAIKKFELEQQHKARSRSKI